MKLKKFKKKEFEMVCLFVSMGVISFVSPCIIFEKMPILRSQKKAFSCLSENEQKILEQFCDLWNYKVPRGIKKIT